MEIPPTYHRFCQKNKTILVNWLYGVSSRLNINPPAIHLAIKIFDQYCIENGMKDYLNPIALVSLYIAAKLECVVNLTISLTDLTQFLDTYTIQDYLRVENKILETLNYQVYDDNLYHIMQRKWKDNCERSTFFLSIMLSTLITLKTNYQAIDNDKLSNKLYYFCHLIKNDHKQLEIEMKTDMVYQYIYYTWTYQINSNFDNINQIINYFSKDSRCGVSEMEIPHFDIPDNICNDLKIFKKTVHSLTNHVTIFNKKTFDRGVNHQTLGKGSYGRVFHYTMEKHDCAVKEIFANCYDFGIQCETLREIYALSIFDHPNITKLYGVYYDREEITYHLIMELHGISLLKAFDTKYLNEQNKSSVIMQLLSAVDYMHNLGIMHRDLSYNNVLINSDGVIKICDLGSCRKFIHSDIDVKYSLLVCVVHFRAIELILDDKHYTEKCDVWSTACLIGYILQQKCIFDIPNSFNSHISMVNNIFKVLGSPTDSYIKKLVKATFPRLLTPYKQERELNNLEEKYPKETDILYEMLLYNPKKRISIHTALKKFNNIY